LDDEMRANAPRDVEYPDSDGRPLADNTLQYQWITTLKGHIDASLPDFVAGELLWYPVEGKPDIRRAPDVLVAFGRPKGHRGSYQQWREAGVAPQVVIEVLSPKNTKREMRDKLSFYELYGVLEYLVIDPDRGRLSVALRSNTSAELALHPIDGRFESARLGLRFEVSEHGDATELRVYGPDGEELPTFEELHADRARQRERAERLARRAAAAEQRAFSQAQRAAEAERAAAEAERAAAEAERAAAEAERAAAEVKALAHKLAERLRELGVDPDQT